MSKRKADALVSTLNDTVPPRLTLMSVAKPWMLASPMPETSHSLAGLPARQFSATTALAGAPQVPPIPPVVKLTLTSAASALPAKSLMRGSAAPPLITRL